MSINESTTQRLRFLVVDDEPLLREMLSDILIELGFSVVGQAGNSREAIEKTEKLQPDIVCLDINMPEVSGLDALASIKTSHAQVLVIMVTASSDSNTVQQAIRTGADGYILKPFNPQQIIKSVSKALAKHNQE